MATLTATNPAPAAQPDILLTASVLPDGQGGFRVKPNKPSVECGPTEAAHLLGIGRSTLCPLLDQPLASKLIKWRWLTPKKGKRVFEVASLHEFRKATQGLE